MEVLQGGKGTGEPPAQVVEVAPIGRQLMATLRHQPKDLALVPVGPDERPLQGLAAFLDWGLAGALSRALEQPPHGWDELLVPGGESVGAERVVLVAFEAEGDMWAHELGERMFGVATGLDARRPAFAVPGLAGGLDGAVACLEGWNAARGSVFGQRQPSVSALACAQPPMVGRLARVLAGPIRPARA